MPASLYPKHKAEGGKVQTEFWRKKDFLSCLGRGPCGRIDEAPPPTPGGAPPIPPAPQYYLPLFPGGPGDMRGKVGALDKRQGG